MPMFHAENRSLQDRHGGRGVADRIVEMVESDSINDDFRAFIEAVPLFFLATASDSAPEYSFKGGAAGFIRVTGPKQIIFPD